MRISFIHSKIIATVSIALVLFLVGLIVFLSLFANNLSNYFMETLSFDIVLQDNISTQQIGQIQQFLQLAPFAKSSTFISKKEAIKQLEKDLGQNPEDFLDYNPLPDLIVVRLNANYAHSDSVTVIEKQLQRFDKSIKTTEYHEKSLHLIDENITKVEIILLAIAGILLFISFALINNIIRLMVYSQRFIIHTMQLIGARKSFICRPFIFSHIRMGLFAAVFACGILYWLIVYITNNMPDISQLYNLQSLLMTFVSIFVMSMLITVVATCMAVNRYIDVDIEGLYKI